MLAVVTVDGIKVTNHDDTLLYMTIIEFLL